MADDPKQAFGKPHDSFPETTVEQTADGAFRRQGNYFPARFGVGPGRLPVAADRYRLALSPGCGWGRRQLIALRLLGLTEVVPVDILTERDEAGWKFEDRPGGIRQLTGVERLNDFYRATDPAFTGRGTSPTVIDIELGQVATNNYHTLSLDWETAWADFHAPGAPQLYPTDLRQEIDLLNQQIFDDVNNGTYKVIFATDLAAARAAKTVFEARLADYDFRLKSRRYLFGDQLTDSDIRLFITLSSYDQGYRPGFPPELGPAVQLSDFPHLWGYARDLFQNGFVDDREAYYLGLEPGPDGQYIPRHQGPAADDQLGPAERLAQWRAPHDRQGLGGSPYYSGPGGGGSYQLWRFGQD
ncbi:MAG: glutathione S-transferase [Propionibacteriaceae bacterium]|jgi:putative glutathione S-transferase|nr:glutathione S-transferase [Propionibacteriaceae bacterium]